MSNPWELVSVVPGGPAVLTAMTEGEAAVLKRLAPGRDCLEIGSAYGFSAITMALAGAKNITAVDSHWSCNSNEFSETFETMTANLEAYGVSGVDIIRHPSEDALPSLAKAGRKFGLIFIDADHSYKSVMHDVVWARQLLADDGYLVCHDYGEDGLPGVTAALDEIFPDGPDEVAGTTFISKARQDAKAVTSGDLLVIVPSRGRPGNIARLLDAVHATRKLETHVHVAIDSDDPEFSRYQYVLSRGSREGDMLHYGERKGLAEWTNEVALQLTGEYPYFASLGDDHVPQTPGWDKALVSAIERMGGTGFAYPWDGTREDIPEAVVMSSNIVQTLGWMCLPSLQHFYVDNVWADLGHGAGCIKHLRAISVDHAHPAIGKAQGDQTYSESGEKLSKDRDAYHEWRRSGRMAEDILAVSALRERILQPA